MSNKLEIVVIMDKSGSMVNLTNDSIGGYNKFLSDQQENNPTANLTTILFDTKLTWFQRRDNIKNAKKLTKETYVPNGGTSLNDAICHALLGLNFIDPARSIIAILTDGEENASVDFSTPRTKELIQLAQKKDWAIVYLAANQDAFAVANKQYGVSLGNIANFANSSLGLQNAINTLSASTQTYASGASSQNLDVQSMYNASVAKSGA